MIFVHLPLRVGVLGCGVIATAPWGYLPNLAKLKDKIQVVAVAAPRIERAQETAEQFGIPAAYPSLEAMLDHADLDTIVNLTPIPAHARATLTAIAAGKHIVTEKPIATTIEEADAIVELARKRDLTVVSAPARRSK